MRCWQVRIDPTRKCVHVNLVKKSNVLGEEEYLFAPCKWWLLDLIQCRFPSR